MATRAQINSCITHMRVCKLQGVPQSILRNRPVPGSGQIMSSGNIVWSDIGPLDPNTPGQSPAFNPLTDVLVWAAFQPRQTYRDQIIEPGAETIPRGQAQCPTIDDPVTQNAVIVNHDDWLIDQAQTIYTILNPQQTPGGELWYFEIRVMR
jgi:hypothetical protein